MATENFNTDIPEDLLTPDTMEFPSSSLSFVDGFPAMESLTDAYDLQDFNRATSLFTSMVPVASLEAIRKGLVDFVGDGPIENQWVIFDDLMDSNSLFLTGNTDTVYAFGILDLEESGPVVIEVPPNCGPSTINDATFSFVVDMGAPGPDRGQGGKYLVLGPDYSGPLSDIENGEVVEHEGETYFVAHSPTRNQLGAMPRTVGGRGDKTCVGAFP